jgi:hypothetical protein
MLPLLSLPVIQQMQEPGNCTRAGWAAEDLTFLFTLTGLMLNCSYCMASSNRDKNYISIIYAWASYYFLTIIETHAA